MKKNDLLIELGGCWRGDWSDFDGRTLRDQLDDWVGMKETKKEFTEFRKRWGMCSHGNGHWAEYCASYCVKNTATTDTEPQ